MLESANSQSSLNEAGLAKVHQEILEQSMQRQNAKKANLLKGARNTTNNRKKVQFSATKSTEQQKLLENIELWKECKWTPSSLSQLVEDVNSNERFKQYRGAIGVRKLLASDISLIQNIIDMNLVPRMIEFLQLKEQPALQVEAAWALANVACGTTAQTQVVLDKGAIPWFIQLLRSKSPEVKDQAIWALGNIAGDSSVYRDRLLANGVLLALLNIVEDPDCPQSMIKNGSWAISSLCRGRPLPPLEKVRSAIPSLCKIIQTQTDADTLIDAVWALSYLSRTDDAAQDLTNCPGAVSAFVSLLSNQDSALLVPCIRTLGNICTGNEAQVDAVIDHPQFFERMYSLLDHKKKTIRRESLWTLSNIAAGIEKQRSRLHQSFPFVQKMISILRSDVNEVRKEALYVFSNALHHGEISVFVSFRDAGLLDCYISILQTENNYYDSSWRPILEGIYSMLNIGKKMAVESHSEQNMVLVDLENTGVLSKFDTLQDSDDDSIYESVTKIIREFIPSIEIRPQRRESEDSDEEYDDDDEDL